MYTDVYNVNVWNSFWWFDSHNSEETLAGGKINEFLSWFRHQMITEKTCHLNSVIQKATVVMIITSLEASEEKIKSLEAVSSL